MAVCRMCTELGNVGRSKHKARKAFGKLIRVIRMSCGETDVEKEVGLRPKGKTVPSRLTKA